MTSDASNGDNEAKKPTHKPTAEATSTRIALNRSALRWDDGTPVVPDPRAWLTDEKGKPHPGAIGSHILDRKRFVTFKDTDAVYAYDSDTEGATYGLYVDGGKPWIKEATQVLVGAAATTTIANQVIGHIQRSTYTDREAVDKVDIDFMPVGNGILWLSTGELVPYTPASVFMAKLPAVFDANADITPIEEYMRSTFAEEDIPAIQEYIGWCLERSMEYQRNLLLKAGGDNGKTVFENIIRAIIGANNVSAVPIQLLASSQFAAVGLYHKIANIVDDIPKTPIKNTGNFKILTGGGTARFERKYEQQFFGQSYAKGIYSANEFPGVDDTTMAFYKRWIVVKMPYTFVDDYDANGEAHTLAEDERFKDFTIEETMTTPTMLSAWLKWMMVGLTRLKKNNRFSTSKRIEDAKVEWILQADSFQIFAGSEITRDKDSYILKKPDLMGAYEGFCESIDASMIRDVEKNIGMRLLGQYPTATKYKPRQPGGGKRSMGWKGVRFVHEAPGQGDAKKTPKRSIHSGVFSE